jgi:hypothetical protein
MMNEARQIADALPPDEVGTCVLDRAGPLFRGDSTELRHALDATKLGFHRGSIRGAFPQLVGDPGA